MLAHANEERKWATLAANDRADGGRQASTLTD